MEETLDRGGVGEDQRVVLGTGEAGPGVAETADDGSGALAAAGGVSDGVGVPGGGFGAGEGGPELALPAAVILVGEAVVGVERGAGALGDDAGDVEGAAERAADDPLYYGAVDGVAEGGEELVGAGFGGLGERGVGAAVDEAGARERPRMADGEDEAAGQVSGRRGGRTGLVCRWMVWRWMMCWASGRGWRAGCGRGDAARC